MGGGEPLKLFGSWADSYTHRIQLGLKLKGLDFEYIEEDPANINNTNNPLPFLLHGDRPAIQDSLIILQYLDDAWPHHPAILPSNPLDRALARFWAHFAQHKLGPAVGAVFATTGEAQRAAVEEVHQNLGLMEREMREGAFKGRRFFGGESIGLLDIVLGCGSYWLAVFEDVADVRLVDPDSFPLFHSWLRDFEAQQEVKDTIPPFDRLIDYARGVRHMLLLAANATPPDKSAAVATPTPTPASAAATSA